MNAGQEHFGAPPSWRIYDQYGFIDQHTPWTIIQPTQFSYYEGKQLPLAESVKLEPEVNVVIK